MEEALVVVDHLGHPIALEVEDARPGDRGADVLRGGLPTEEVGGPRRTIAPLPRRCRQAVRVVDGIGALPRRADLGEAVPVEVRHGRRAAIAPAGDRHDVRPRAASAHQHVAGGSLEHAHFAIADQDDLRVAVHVEVGHRAQGVLPIDGAPEDGAVPLDGDASGRHLRVAVPVEVGHHGVREGLHVHQAGAQVEEVHRRVLEVDAVQRVAPHDHVGDAVLVQVGHRRRRPLGHAHAPRLPAGQLGHAVPVHQTQAVGLEVVEHLQRVVGGVEVGDRRYADPVRVVRRQRPDCPLGRARRAVDGHQDRVGGRPARVGRHDHVRDAVAADVSDDRRPDHVGVEGAADHLPLPVPLDLELDAVEVGQDLAGRLPVGDRQAAAHHRLAVVPLGQAIEIVPAGHPRGGADVVQAHVARGAAQLVGRPAERLPRGTIGSANDPVETNLSAFTAHRAIVATARVLADGEAVAVVDTLLAFSAARQAAEAGLGDGAHLASVGDHPGRAEPLEAHFAIGALASGDAGRGRAVIAVAGGDGEQERERAEDESIGTKHAAILPQSGAGCERRFC